MSKSYKIPSDKLSVFVSALLNSPEALQTFKLANMTQLDDIDKIIADAQQQLRYDAAYKATHSLGAEVTKDELWNIVNIGNTSRERNDIAKELFEHLFCVRMTQQLQEFNAYYSPLKFEDGHGFSVNILFDGDVIAEVQATTQDQFLCKLCLYRQYGLQGLNVDIYLDLFAKIADAYHKINALMDDIGKIATICYLNRFDDIDKMVMQ